MGTTTITHTGESVPAIQAHACSTCEAIAALLRKAQAGNPKARVPKGALRIEARMNKAETSKLKTDSLT